MKITLKQLRSLIREVAVSAKALDVQAVDSPLKNKNVMTALAALDKAFTTALFNNLLANAKQHITPTKNKEGQPSAELDDEMSAKMNQAVDAAGEELKAHITRGLDIIWKEAHKTSSAQPKQAQKTSPTKPAQA